MGMSLNPDNYRLLAQSKVDDTEWYTVKCLKPAPAAWVRSHDIGLWFEHIDSAGYIDMSTFDLQEKLYLLFKLKWS